MKKLMLIGAMVLVASAAQAQNAPPTTEYRLSIYLQGGANPVSTAVLPASTFQCGQPTVPVTGTQVNPTKIRFEDPAAPATLDCVYTDNGTGPLLGLPFNPTAVYEASIVAVNVNGNSPVSPRSNPFTRPGTVPNAPGRLRIGG